MKIITTASEMLTYSTQCGLNGCQISFVPTMGALHNGHISLVEHAKRNKTKVVVSVFVNPTQFNDTSDLENYPRTFDSDSEVLREARVDVMFYPSVAEVYPSEEFKVYNLDGLDERMEGPNRPGHFNGVVQVVTRLFDMVKPDIALFGEKDFQQLAVIRHMSTKLGYETEIVGCPTVREISGLALSSRNARLSEKGKLTATEIYGAFLKLKTQLSKGVQLSEARAMALADLNKTDKLELEYLELVDPISLKPVKNEALAVQACIAAWVDGVRLIDNMRVK